MLFFGVRGQPQRGWLTSPELPCTAPLMLTMHNTLRAPVCSQPRAHVTLPRKSILLHINRLAAFSHGTVQGLQAQPLQHESLQLVEDEAAQDAQRSNAAVVDASQTDAEGVDERERLRRSRISSANKGKVPWNKGRKHSPGAGRSTIAPLHTACLQRQLPRFESAPRRPCGVPMSRTRSSPRSTYHTLPRPRCVCTLHNNIYTQIQRTAAGQDQPCSKSHTSTAQGTGQPRKQRQQHCRDNRQGGTWNPSENKNSRSHI